MTIVTTSPADRGGALARPIAKGASLAMLGLVASVLAGAPAQAQGITTSKTCTVNQGPLNACNLTPGTSFGVLGDKEVFFKGFTIDPVGATGVNVVFSWFDPDGGGNTYANDFWTFAVSAAPTISGPLTLAYSYDVKIVGAGSEPWFFDTVALESDVVTDNDPGVDVSKFTNPEGVVLTSTNGQANGAGKYTFLGDYKTISITDNVNVATFEDTLSSVTNKWTQRERTTSVPGPLPILGAGVAFGMSRRLRRRISTANFT